MWPTLALCVICFVDLGSDEAYVSGSYFQVYEEGTFHFAMFYIYYVMVLVQLVLSSFVETHQRRGHQAVGKVSDLQMSVEWGSSLICKQLGSGWDAE